MAQNDTVKLIGSSDDPFSIRPRVALHLKSIKYEYLEEPDDDLGEKSQLLLKSNPIHKKTPVLIHGDLAICESLNIVQYIEEAWPSDPSILPSNAYDRASARFWAQYIDDKCFEAANALTGANNDEERIAATGKLTECLAILEETFQKSSKGLGFFGGETIGYLDIACAALLGPISVIEMFSADKFVREETTPGLIQWAVRFRAHEAVRPYMPTVEEVTELVKQRIEEGFKRNFKSNVSTSEYE
ncbi:Glutathione S-transferase N-terminal [Arabidopsis suecica]|uniref:Glutathione S-transferase n=1 Tax=Arabidopsis suecica TaxID=45249 RepID=A0A8T2HA61_ARASU|nr:Glutathione S-transferase N-terminal [Arabidopsis suecica]